MHVHVGRRDFDNLPRTNGHGYTLTMAAQSSLPSAPIAVVVQVVRGQAGEREKRFTAGFKVGRSRECDLQIEENCVSRVPSACQIRRLAVVARKDMESANGTFMNGVRIQDAPIFTVTGGVWKNTE